MALAGHYFCKDISNLEVTGNTRKRNDTSVQCFSNRVTIHLNMLCVLMINKIKYNLNSTSVIIMERNAIRLGETEHNKKPTKPTNFRTSSRHCTIFKFSWIFQNTSLLFTLPRNQRIFKEETPASDRTTSIRTTGLISITISNETKRRANKEEQSTNRRPLKISNDMMNDN